MSIWGKRVDAWFDRTTGDKISPAEWNRRGLNFIWQAALVIAVAILATIILGDL